MDDFNPYFFSFEMITAILIISGSFMFTGNRAGLKSTGFIVSMTGRVFFTIICLVVGLYPAAVVNAILVGTEFRGYLNNR